MKQYSIAIDTRCVDKKSASNYRIFLNSMHSRHSFKSHTVWYLSHSDQAHTHSRITKSHHLGREGRALIWILNIWIVGRIQIFVRQAFARFESWRIFGYPLRTGTVFALLFICFRLWFLVSNFRFSIKSTYVCILSGKIRYLYRCIYRYICIDTDASDRVGSTPKS